MPLSREKKGTVLGELEKKFASAKAILFTHSTNISVEKMRELRKSLKGADTEYVVVKKSLLGIALGKANIGTDGIDIAATRGTIGVAIASGDEVAATRTLALFAKIKENETFKLFGGVYEKKPATLADIALLAKASTKNDLVSGLLRQLNAPIAKVVYAVKAIADTKQAAG
ncbi:MAG: 50S ribosomal protein L10 [Patescibacteria group bacterium]